MANNNQHSGQALFTPISHTLRNFGQEDIRRFLRASEQYLLRVQDENISEAHMTPASVKASVSPDLVLSMVEIEYFLGVRDLSELDDCTLLEWLEGHNQSNQRKFTLDALKTDVKHNVKIAAKEREPGIRNTRVFLDYRTHLRKRRGSNLISDRPDIAIHHICLLFEATSRTSKRTVHHP